MPIYMTMIIIIYAICTLYIAILNPAGVINLPFHTSVHVNFSDMTIHIASWCTLHVMWSPLSSLCSAKKGRQHHIEWWEDLQQLMTICIFHPKWLQLSLQLSVEYREMGETSSISISQLWTSHYWWGTDCCGEMMDLVIYTNKLFTLQQGQWVVHYPPMNTACSITTVISTSDGIWYYYDHGHI